MEDSADEHSKFLEDFDRTLVERFGSDQDQDTERTPATKRSLERYPWMPKSLSSSGDTEVVPPGEPVPKAARKTTVNVDGDAPAAGGDGDVDTEPRNGQMKRPNENGEDAGCK